MPEGVLNVIENWLPYTEFGTTDGIWATGTVNTEIVDWAVPTIFCAINIKGYVVFPVIPELIRSGGELMPNVEPLLNLYEYVIPDNWVQVIWKDDTSIDNVDGFGAPGRVYAWIDDADDCNAVFVALSVNVYVLLATKPEFIVKGGVTLLPLAPVFTVYEYVIPANVDHTTWNEELVVWLETINGFGRFGAVVTLMLFELIVDKIFIACIYTLYVEFCVRPVIVTGLVAVAELTTAILP